MASAPLATRDLDHHFRRFANNPRKLGQRRLAGSKSVIWTCNALVPVTCLSFCHLSFKSQGADAAQI